MDMVKEFERRGKPDSGMIGDGGLAPKSMMNGHSCHS